MSEEHLREEIIKLQQQLHMAEFARDQWRERFEDFCLRVHAPQNFHEVILERNQLRMEVDRLRERCEHQGAQIAKIREELLLRIAQSSPDDP